MEIIEFIEIIENLNKTKKTIDMTMKTIENLNENKEIAVQELINRRMPLAKRMV